MSFGQLLLVLNARKRLIIIIITTVFALVMGASLLLAPKYTATASVVIDIKSPDPIAGMVLPGVMTPGYLATQLDLIQSDRVMRGVIRQFRLTENPTLHEKWQDATDGEGSMETWLVEQLQRYLDIKPSRESSLINITYSAPDPTFAAAMANAIARNYIGIMLELRTEPAKQFRSMFEQQAKEARTRLESAQSKLSAYQNDKGLISSAADERIDIENLRLTELTNQLVMLQSVAGDARGRQVAAAGNSEQLSEVLNNPVIGQLKTDLSRSEARLKELSAHFGEAHPQVTELKANIAETRARLEQETRKISNSLGVNNTANRLHEAQLQAQLEDQRQKVMRLRKQRDEANVLVHDVETAQRDYDTITARLSQSALESQSNQTNVSLVQEAIPPYKPSSPKMVLNAILSILVGTMIAVVSALMLELRDRRLRTEDDVEEGLGVPLLGLLPERDPVAATGVRRLIPFIGNKDVPRLTGPGG